MANPAIWPLLLIPHASVFASPGKSMLVYFLPFFTKPCWTLPESRYRPTTSPLSLIPIAWVPLDFGKLMGVNFPAEYTNPVYSPVLVLVHQPAAPPTLLMP